MIPALPPLFPSLTLFWTAPPVISPLSLLSDGLKEREVDGKHNPPSVCQSNPSSYKQKVETTKKTTWPGFYFWIII